MSPGGTASTPRAAAADLARLCGYLPLTIALLAGRLAHHPGWTLPGFAAQFTAAPWPAHRSAPSNAIPPGSLNWPVATGTTRTRGPSEALSSVTEFPEKFVTPREVGRFPGEGPPGGPGAT